MSRKVVTSARVQAYAIGNTNSMTPVTSDSCVDKGTHVQSPAAQSLDGEWRVHGKNHWGNNIHQSEAAKRCLKRPFACPLTIEYS